MYSLTRLGRAIDTVIPIKRYEGGWGGGKGKYEDIFCSTLCSSDSLTYCWAFFKLDFFNDKKQVLRRLDRQSQNCFVGEYPLLVISAQEPILWGVGVGGFLSKIRKT